MAHGRQSSEWAQTLAAITSMGNLFADRANQRSIKELIPAHLLSDDKPMDDPEEIKANWSEFKSMVKHGKR